MPHSRVDESVVVDAENAAVDTALALLKAALPKDIVGDDAIEALKKADQPPDLTAADLADLHEKYFILAGATKYIQDLEHRRKQLRQQTQDLRTELHHLRKTCVGRW